jgi:hypothetical protein
VQEPAGQRGRAISGERSPLAPPAHWPTNPNQTVRLSRDFYNLLGLDCASPARQKFFHALCSYREDRWPSDLLYVSAIDQFSRLFGKPDDVAHRDLIPLQGRLVILQNYRVRHGYLARLITFPDLYSLRGHALEHGKKLFIASLPASRIATAALSETSCPWRLPVSHVGYIRRS